ncbi:dolichyl-diphosphooligosaccharide--protein glycosyltransferase 48 kDa subunit-like [Ixodes scapularis]|uniref:dolichyl-diphosphooligosaccharide--protein glycosyltransferase 48 kDa subunit-like n=1 Tax=Ixodes scapularis TaxID=6945 RepID=UPI001C37FDFC|nr:dolichyl-diphosphooligosaccharide--protein glycosyltransferase 48 kDa subunit-like [Ixodes scapularis]
MFHIAYVRVHITAFLQHTTIVAESENVIKAPTVVGSKNIPPVLFRGVGYVVVGTNFLCYEALTAPSIAYSYNPDNKITEYPHAVGKNTLLVSALQARNNVRVVFCGFLVFFSDKLFTSPVLNAHGGKRYESASNQALPTALSQWVFKEKKVLRAQNVRHHAKDQKRPPEAYTITDDVVRLMKRDSHWVPFDADDLQMEFVLIDSFVRTKLVEKGQKCESQFKVLDVYGVYQFKVGYNRVGCTHLDTIPLGQVSVQPLQHTQYERFIPSAYPYCPSAFSMMFGVFLLSCIFLHLGHPRHNSCGAFTY